MELVDQVERVDQVDQVDCVERVDQVDQVDCVEQVDRDKHVDSLVVMAEIVFEPLFGRIGGQELGVYFPVLCEPLGEHRLYSLRRDLAEKDLEHLDYQLELCVVVDHGFSHLDLGLVAFGHLLLGFAWEGHKVGIAVGCGGSLGPDPHVVFGH